MEGLLSLLLFAAVFFVMMRFGCGAHMMHGGHGKHSHGTGSGKDPVCGMQVAPDHGYSKVHDGDVFRFCSRSCLDKFEREPDSYLSSTNTTEVS
jgi:YHS domain-containing protein